MFLQIQYDTNYILLPLTKEMKLVGYRNLASVVTIPEGVTEIGEFAFAGIPGIQIFAPDAGIDEIPR